MRTCRITLPKQVIEEAAQIGAGRQEIKARISERYDQNDPWREHTMGAKGGFAFSELAKKWGVTLEVDKTFEAVRRSFVDFHATIGWDAKPVTIDVKATSKTGHPTMLLLKQIHAKKAAEILILARIVENKVCFLGWEWRDTVMLQPPRRTGHEYMNHCLDSRKLRPMDTLKELLEMPLIRKREEDDARLQAEAIKNLVAEREARLKKAV